MECDPPSMAYWHPNFYVGLSCLIYGLPAVYAISRWPSPFHMVVSAVSITTCVFAFLADYVYASPGKRSWAGLVDRFTASFAYIWWNFWSLYDGAPWQVVLLVNLIIISVFRSSQQADSPKAWAWWHVLWHLASGFFICLCAYRLEGFPFIF